MRILLGLTFLVLVLAGLAAAPGDAQQAAPVAAVPLQFPPLAGDHLVLPLIVHDGDTFTFAWLVKDTSRVFGINAPEVTGPQKPDGLKAKAYLQSLLPVDKPIIVRVYGRDKFGRALIEPFTADGKKVADLMIGAGHARAWDGQGAKP